MSKPIDDGAHSQIPYIHRPRIRWGDTDAARIAYTGAFPQYGLDAIEDFHLDVFGENWYANTLDKDRGNPFVHLSIDFHASITPRDSLQIVVWIEKIGRTSLSYLLEGHVTPSGKKSFTARFTCVFVRSSTRKKIEVPDEVRTRAEAYQRACAAVPGPGEFSLMVV